MRVKFCVKCKTYIRIFSDNPISQNIEHSFDIKHHNHTLITGIRDELDKSYEKDQLDQTN